MSLPSAEDLFRPAPGADEQQGASEQPRTSKPAVRAVPDDATPAEPAATRKRPSGRVRHDEKMTVYVTSEELLEIEQARLVLRSQHGLAVDRGRLVREALHLVLADLEEHGSDSALVRRLTER